jgi:hypothetical protein
MKIETTKKVTRFYFKRKEEEKMKTILQQTEELKGTPFNWSVDGYFYINRPITGHLLEKLQKSVNLPHMPAIIKGYSGCPVTGGEFSWKF